MWRTAWRRRCPACGEGPHLARANALRASCGECGLDLIGEAGAQYGGAIGLGYGIGGTAGLAVFIGLVSVLGYATWMVWVSTGVVVVTVLVAFRPCKAWWTWWLYRTGELRGGRRDR
jgi:uncharacterized protein (DUF983 family)